MHRHFQNDRHACTENEHSRFCVEGSFGRYARSNGSDRERHDGCGRYEHKYVFVHDDIARRLALYAVCIDVDDFDGDRNRYLNTRVAAVCLAFYVYVGNRSDGRSRARADKGKPICRIGRHGIFDPDGIVFKARLNDARVEDFFRLNTHLFAKTVQRIARNRAGAVIL